LLLEPTPEGREVTNPVAPKSSSSLISRLHRPVGRLGMAVLTFMIVAAPWVLFFDPIAFPRRAHIPRDPIAIYRLYSDDFAYVAASRTLSRTLSNLFVPHNTHIVPAWRVLTWALVAWAGSLEKLPEVLAEAAYGILVAVMLLMGRLVARETGRAGVGLAAMIAVGTTSLMAPSARWYSAGQTLWAGFGILATLWYSQCWRRSRRVASLVLACLSAMLSGWFWTIGHLAGPVAAIYLWVGGRRRGRWVAGVPLFASLLAVAASLTLGGGKIDSTVSFHGRTTSQAARPREGILHTAQAIPENLIVANLGLRARTTQTQGIVMSLLILGFWSARRWRQGGAGAFNPLECTGMALALGSYFLEWTVRGYFDFDLLRTLNMGYIVPWYDTIPQIGAVLFLAGWFSGPMPRDRRPAVLRPLLPARRFGAIGVSCLMAILILLNWPRVDLLWRKSAPPLLPLERERFPIVSLQTLRANLVLLDQAAWQRRHLKRLDQAQQVVSRLGISEGDVRSAFGRLDMPELPKEYDAVGLLYFPTRERAKDLNLVRRALGPYLFKEKEPRPAWIPPGTDWPPRESPEQLRVEMYGAE
jgi:hypothetical protein